MIGQKKTGPVEHMGPVGPMGICIWLLLEDIFRLVRPNEPNQPDSFFAQILDPEDQSCPTWLDFGPCDKDYLGFFGFLSSLTAKIQRK